MTHHLYSHLCHRLRAGMLAALAVTLSACASTPTTVPHQDRAIIKRVGVISLVEDEIHAYFKVGPVMREKVGASVRETYLGPSVLGRWPINRSITAAAGKALDPRYQYVPLTYDPAKLAKEAYRPNPDYMNLERLKPDLQRISGGKVDTLVLISTSGSVTRVVGRKIWLAGYGFYRQSILPGAPTVDYAALRVTVVDGKTMKLLADRSAFATQRLPASLWEMNVTTITPQERNSLLEHVTGLLHRTVGQLIHEIGLGKPPPP